MPFISVTRLRVRSLLYLPAFIWQAMGSLRQSQRSRGFLAGRVLHEARNAMNAFRTTGAHRDAMPKLLEWCDEASVAHWIQPNAELPSWLEAHRRMVAEGRLSKVNHPSPAQVAKEIPAPRPSRIEKTLIPLS